MGRLYRIMKTIWILLISVFTMYSCQSQEKETIYLLFENNKIDICNVSPYRDGRNKKESKFTYLKSDISENHILFEICNQFFEFDPKNQSKEIIKNTNLNIVTIDYLLNKLENDFVNKGNLDKKRMFKHIYILEKINDNEYVRYEVLWKDMYINRH